MADHAAVISLKQTIQRLLNSSQISLLPSSRDKIKFAYEAVISLQEILFELESSSKMVDSSREQITEASYKLEDAVESYVLDQFLSQSESLGDHKGSSMVFSLDFDEVLKQEINSFTFMAKKMGYYVFMISFKQELEHALNSSQISIHDPSSRDIIEFAYERVRLLQQVLQNLGSEMVDYSLLEQIREAAYKIEDAIESHLSDQFLSRSERLGDEVLKQEINYFADMVKKMEDESSKQLDLELSNPLPEEDDVDASTIDFGGAESKMVGLSDLFDLVKKSLLDYRFRGHVVPISGMAGIGKTTLARKIYQDPQVINYFHCRVWVTIGPKCQLRKIILDILAQLDHDIDNIQTEGDEKLGEYLKRSLENKTYLLVLDDVWNVEDWDDIRKYLPVETDQSRVLLVTRLQHVARYSEYRLYEIFEMRFLNKEESWHLLREKVFGEEQYPFQLERAGKKIAQNCDGLPLLIITVADLLSKAEKTLEYWNKVADKKDMSIFIEANDKISNILLRSYKYLPLRLKSRFLYMGVFPSKCIIHCSKLFDLWMAEDLTDSKYDAKYDLGMLVSSNLVLAHQNSSTYGIKTCSMHSSFWHACVKQSRKEKFLHVISSPAGSFRDGEKSRRRLCTYKNVLFGIKEVYNLVESISSARSLICCGPYHQYPVPICFGLRLLKVLNVLSIRFYKFPIEVLKLIHLRFLALTYNGKVHASISKLWNLEYLIVGRHLNIKFPRDWSYLPVEIWNLQKLKHLQVMGSCLPYHFGAFLPNLLKLSNISAHSCTKEILERIPNLNKLGIQIELAPDADEPLSCFDHLSYLSELRSLKCVIVNPNLAKPQVVAPPTYISSFPSNLAKLSLSGFGYPWEYIHIIAKLPSLRVLKLRNYAFRGREWVVHEDDFLELNFLLLEDIDLVHLRSDGPCFPNLCTLVIRHCYKLKEIPLELAVIDKTELIDSLLVANYIRKMRWTTTPLQVYSSWEDEKHKA